MKMFLKIISMRNKKKMIENILNRTERLDKLAAFYQNNGFSLTHGDIRDIDVNVYIPFLPDYRVELALINHIGKPTDSHIRKHKLMPCGNAIRYPQVALLSDMVQYDQPPFNTLELCMVYNRPPDPYMGIYKMSEKSHVGKKSVYIEEQIKNNGILICFFLELHIFSYMEAINFCGIFLITPRSDTRISHLKNFVRNWFNDTTNPQVQMGVRMILDVTVFRIFSQFVVDMYEHFKLHRADGARSPKPRFQNGCTLETRRKLLENVIGY